MRVCGKIAGIAGARVARRCAVRGRACAVGRAAGTRCFGRGSDLPRLGRPHEGAGVVAAARRIARHGCELDRRRFRCDRSRFRAGCRVGRDADRGRQYRTDGLRGAGAPGRRAVRTGRLHPTRCRADPVDYQYGGQSACRRRSVCGSAGAIARGIGYQQPAYRFERHRRQWPACETISRTFRIRMGDCRYRIRSGLAEGAGASRDRCVRDLLRRVRVASCRLARAFRWRDCGQSSGFHLATRRNARECRQ